MWIVAIRVQEFICSVLIAINCSKKVYSPHKRHIVRMELECTNMIIIIVRGNLRLP